jgi:hypothetical protein
MTGSPHVRPRALEDVLARGPQAAVMQDQVRRVGGCEQPIRLRGRADLVDVVTGECGDRGPARSCQTGQ